MHQVEGLCFYLKSWLLSHRWRGEVHWVFDLSICFILPTPVPYHVIMWWVFNDWSVSDQVVLVAILISHPHVNQLQKKRTHLLAHSPPVLLTHLWKPTCHPSGPPGTELIFQSSKTNFQFLRSSAQITTSFWGIINTVCFFLKVMAIFMEMIYTQMHQQPALIK